MRFLRKVTKTGTHSLTITIPKKLRNQFNIKANDIMEVQVCGKYIMLKKAEEE